MINGTKVFRTGVVLLTTFILQAAFASQIPIVDVRVDLMLPVAVGAGIVAGAERGALVGFLGGLLVDLLTQTPYGLSALAFSLAGYSIGGFERGLLGGARWIRPVIAGVAGLGAVLVFGLAGAVLGNADWLDSYLVRVAVIDGVMTAALTPIVVPIMSWTDGEALGLDLDLGRFWRARIGRPGTVFRR